MSKEQVIRLTKNYIRKVKRNKEVAMLGVLIGVISGYIGYAIGKAQCRYCQLCNDNFFDDDLCITDKKTPTDEVDRGASLNEKDQQ